MSRDGGTTNSCESTTAPASPAFRADSRPKPRNLGLLAIYPREVERLPETWRVRERLLLGRARDAQVMLADEAVSRRHAELEPAQAGLRVADLGSNHGTFVDGEAVGREGRVVHEGSLVRAGNTLLLVVDDVNVHAVPMRRIAADYLGLARDVIGGPLLCKVWQNAAHVADLAHPVLILGETGSGKEAVARLVHAMRATPGPFVALNLAAIPEGLFESELFGHVRGSFTGAHGPRAGALREATGGVLFIDEVADLRLDLQAKLLRAIDQMSVRPLGASGDVKISTRVIAATSQDPRKACAEGRFREDLYYRLSGVVLEVPPLRERRADIPAMAAFFLARECPELRLSVRAAETLALAHWRGNVRELYHAMARASVVARSSGSTEVLPEHLPELDVFEAPDETPLTPDAIELALQGAGGNASVAARTLGVSRSTLYNVLKRQGIDPRALRARK